MNIPSAHERDPLGPTTTARRRRWIGLATVLAVCACDAEGLGPGESLDPFGELEHDGSEADGSFRDSYCDIVVNVSGCKGNFVNGVYRWDTTKGYHLEKDWEDYVFQSFVKPSEDQVNHWAIVYEGFHRNGDWHPAYTEVFVAESPGGLPNTATWPDGVIVRCDY